MEDQCGTNLVPLQGIYIKVFIKVGEDTRLPFKGFLYGITGILLWADESDPNIIWRKEQIFMREREETFVVCYSPNGTVHRVPNSIFTKVVMEMENPDLSKYVTYKEGSRMYRMSEKFFREWTNKIGAAKHITENKVIVSVKVVDDYLKYL